jgi:hypothetical protein
MSAIGPLADIAHHTDKFCHCRALVSDHHFQRKEKQMTETNHKALAIAQTYVNAIAKKNVDAMIAVSADGVVCTPPLGRITGTQKFS